MAFANSWLTYRVLLFHFSGLRRPLRSVILTRRSVPLPPHHPRNQRLLPRHCSSFTSHRGGREARIQLLAFDCFRERKVGLAHSGYAMTTVFIGCLCVCHCVCLCHCVCYG